MRFLSLSLLIALVGCSVDNASKTSADQTSPLASQALEKATDSLVGTYATKIMLNGSSKALKANPLVPDSSGISYIYRLSQIAKVGSGLQITEKACAVATDKNSKVKLTLKSDVVQQSLVQTSDLIVESIDGELQISRGSAAQVFGVKMENPTTDLMPVNASDELLLDDIDGDNNPGATGYADAGFFLKGNIYFAQRSINNYSLHVSPAGELSGPYEDVTNQIVFGTSNIAMNIALTNFGTIVTTEKIAREKNGKLKAISAKSSTIQFTKIEDNADCDSVLSTLNVE